MTLLLLQSVPSLGEKFQVVTVGDDVGLALLSRRWALVLTPSVRKRFAGLIVEKHLSPAANV